jgi:type II secretory pathway component PulF
MIFSARLPLQSLIELCRVLRHNLSAGLTLRTVFRQQAERGTAAVRPVAQRIGHALEQGNSLEAALDREKSAFPPLFLSLAAVGEETGHLPEVFGELEKYYILQQRLRRQFRSQSMLPIIQFVLALFVIAVMIYALGIISAARGGPSPPGILGLTGGFGALIFLVLSFGSIAMLIGLYLLLTRTLQQKPIVDAFLLRVPVLGKCLEALALGRFTLGLQLTLETGMPIMKALRLSLAATGNAAYQAQTQVVVQSLKSGDSLSVALAKADIFPYEFLEMIAVSEEGGRVPEMMRHQAEHYNEEASRRLTALTGLLSHLVWVIYAVFVIIAIFKIAGIYLTALGG